MGEVLGARNPTTIREHLRNIQEEAHVMRERLSLAWLESDRDAVERIVGHAVAALDQLNNAEREWIAGTSPLAPDHYTGNRLVPDPDPGVGAEHA